jgi:hypothetical protein
MNRGGICLLTVTMKHGRGESFLWLTVSMTLPEPSKPNSRRRTMDDWEALQEICLFIIYMTIVVGFGLLVAFWIMA